MKFTCTVLKKKWFNTGEFSSLEKECRCIIEQFRSPWLLIIFSSMFDSCLWPESKKTEVDRIKTRSYVLEMDQEVGLAVKFEREGEDRNASDQSMLIPSAEKGVVLTAIRVRHVHSPSTPY